MVGRAPIVKDACDALDIPFGKNIRWPLEPGSLSRGQRRTMSPTGWSGICQKRQHGRDWFRDVEAMGDVIEMSIDHLAAELYGIYPWQLRPWESENTISQSVADILKDQLCGQNRPRLQRLHASILLGDESRPVEHILREGWERLPDSPDVLEKIRSLLEDEHVPDLNAGDDHQTIVSKVRRWAVAGWLKHEGVPAEAFPDPIAGSDLSYAFRRLKRVLQTDVQTRALAMYQQAYWPDVVAQLDDPWIASACPVDGALEARLWRSWLRDFDEGAYPQCQERAHARTEALCEATKRNYKQVGKESPSWIRAWRQAASLAELAHRYETWDSRDAPIHALYADREDGSWHIDAAVRRIIVSGTPEDDLPSEHPARSALAQHRQALVSDRYLQYLRSMAEKMKVTLESGQLLDDGFRSSTTFWSDHSEELAAGNEAILFYLDALRLDLARDLADRLKELAHSDGDVDLNVRESLRLGVLPSETAFGMAAVLPGRPRAFEVKMVGDKLRALRSGRTLDTTQRVNLLDNEGWAVAPKNPSAWSNPLVAYMDTELDDIGETDLAEIEKKLADRVEELADLIFKKMRQGNWTRAYVVTDHGFVLLPEQTTFEALTSPTGEIKRRRVAGEELDQQGPGVLAHAGANPRTLVPGIARAHLARSSASVQ